ncbi:hypothetical protein [Cytobacillus horneckiae]|uniref:hypothetical protein n=1 Tax=Cytobacillus horneckiae TaxID=549687 RepID=UPI003D9A1857
MVKMQMPKGYQQRRRDKQQDRWKRFLRKEKRKIAEQNTSKKGEVRLANQVEREILEAMQSVQLANEQANNYKKYWQAEKRIANTWRKQNEELREKLKVERRNNMALTVFNIVLIAALVLMLGGGMQ